MAPKDKTLLRSRDAALAFILGESAPAEKTEALHDPAGIAQAAMSQLPPFIRTLVGRWPGPCIYDGRDMHAAHAKLPINNAHFNALTEDLYIAFDRVGVSYALQNQMVAPLAPMQRDIVKR